MSAWLPLVSCITGFKIEIHSVDKVIVWKRKFSSHATGVMLPSCKSSASMFQRGSCPFYLNTKPNASSSRRNKMPTL